MCYQSICINGLSESIKLRHPNNIFSPYCFTRSFVKFLVDPDSGTDQPNASQKGFFLTRYSTHFEGSPILLLLTESPSLLEAATHDGLTRRWPDSDRTVGLTPKNLLERTKHTTAAAGRSRPSLDSFSRCVSRRSWPCVTTTTRHNLRRARSFQ